MSNNLAPFLKRGTKVMCHLVKNFPEHISRKTGLLKPARTETHILSGTVRADHGDTVSVAVVYPSGYTTVRLFFHHELTVDSPEILNTYRNPLGG